MKNINRITKLVKQLFINFLFLSSPVVLLAQTVDYNDLDNWGHLCYCATNNTFHPEIIVRADNNWQLLFAMKDGLTLKQIDSLKIPYSQSQLLLLRSHRLLNRSQNIYKTAIPILDIEQTANLRKQSQLVANSIYLEIEKSCRNLVSHLSEQNRSNNAFSILFSYVIDGLSWKRFEKENLVEEREFGMGIWDGNYWFLTPKRQVDLVGTNSLINGDIVFKCNWSEVENKTEELLDKKPDRLFPFVLEKTVPSKELIDEFKDFGLFDKNFNLTIPIINEKENSSLYLLSNDIIDKLLAAFLAKTNIDEIKNLYKFNDSSETVVIFYHEVLFDLKDLLLKNQVIQKPTLFKSPDKATLADVADLCFIVIRGN